MGQCNCQKENSLLENEGYRKNIFFLLLIIIIGLFFIYKNCSK